MTQCLNSLKPLLYLFAICLSISNTRNSELFKNELTFSSTTCFISSGNKNRKATRVVIMNSRKLHAQYYESPNLLLLPSAKIR
ncbi:hypothetical protein CW304_09155 [Bacillus sp. UFRGS-B20]|nr:hypothetical protein CW304_09155 [Bacillus sp. UFRGS-B20]